MGYLGEIDGEPVEFSHHALERMVEMGVSGDVAREALMNPDHVSDSVKYDGCQNYHYGDLTFGVNRTGGHLVVVTVVYRTKSAWVAAYESGQLGAGREIRAHISLPE